MDTEFLCLYACDTNTVQIHSQGLLSSLHDGILYAYCKLMNNDENLPHNKKLC